MAQYVVCYAGPGQCVYGKEPAKAEPYSYIDPLLTIKEAERTARGFTSKGATVVICKLVAVKRIKL